MGGRGESCTELLRRVCPPGMDRLIRVEGARAGRSGGSFLFLAPLLNRRLCLVLGIVVEGSCMDLGLMGTLPT